MRLPLLLWLTSAVDLLRSVACIADMSALESTALYPLRPLGHILAGWLGLLSAGAAIAWLRFPSRNPWTALALVPQFGVLLIGAWSGLAAIAIGRYSDGTAIPPAHIFTDQIVWILLPVFYGAAAAVEVRRSGVVGAT